MTFRTPMRTRYRKTTLIGTLTLSLLASPVVAETRYVPTMYLEHADGRMETMILPGMEQGEPYYDCKKQSRIWT